MKILITGYIKQLLKKNQDLSSINFKNDNSPTDIKMVNVYSIPGWFFGYDIIFGIALLIITLAVSLYSFKIYKLSNQRQSKFFGIAFLLFSISYLVELIINFAILSDLTDAFSVLEINELINLNFMSILVHMIFFTSGLATLIYMISNFKDKKIYFGLLIASLLSLILFGDRIYLFYILSSSLLFLIMLFYAVNSFKEKNRKTILITLAFFFLLVSHIHFIFSVNHTLYYIIGNSLELIAYFFVLINFLKVLKK